MNRVRSLARAHWADVLIVAIALDAVFEVLVREGDDAPRSAAAFAAPAAAAVVLPLLLRRRFAFAAPAGVWLVATAVSFADGRVVSFTFGVLLGGMAAAYLLGNQRDDRQARLGLAVVLVGALIIVQNDPGHVDGQYLFVPAQFGICWIAGYALRERAARAEAAEASARVAVAEERTRIARELHDVVAHAVSVMVLQVGAVRHRLPAELDEDTEALRRVEHAGRTALTEMRALLGSMRQEGEAAELGPQPRLAEVDALIGDVRRAGLDVELRVEGTPPAELPGAIELSVYRIIQEALTNTLKHAQASRAEVVIRYGAEQLEVEVSDDGRAGASNGVPGYGLVGVGERVKIYGGEMSAGRGPDGGFTLRTRLPVRGAAA